jgi:iron complex transport system permease protein
MTRRRIAALALTTLLIAALTGELCFGAAPVPLQAIVTRLLHPGAAADADSTIVFSLRLPRALLAVLAGAALAQAGTTMQALFRNPLAEPGLAGVSAGSSLGAAVVFAFGGIAVQWAFLAPWLLPAAAFIGGALAAAIVVRLARVGDHTATGHLLLAGIAINAVAGAGIGWLSLRAPAQVLHNYLAWAYGDLGRSGWNDLVVITPLLLLATAAPLRDARRFDAILLGDAEAAHLGVDVEGLKRRALGIAVLAAAATAAAAGPIAFVGLIAPHIARRLFGTPHRRLFPAAALTGATLLTLADLAARLLALPAELPVGVLTALIGGPFFLGLLAAQRHVEGEA